MKKIALIGLLLVSTNAFSWTATYLGGGNWAIGCANGTNWSYSGSSAGLDIVGPALCPGGIVAPQVPNGVIAGIPSRVKVNILKNIHEVNERSAPAARSYPPKGYPCLGCHPCRDKSGDFCDNDSKNRVFIARPVSRRNTHINL